ncbi:hypothetical protein B0T16DRAFT_388186 [Cercophora newfieldiana]|uniref:Uncharacterized protein n=1 Tax=Cercophora newfieldiana TaxID=92897 RepID=A0AA40CVG4_9PEZI|nr:hypothetical protein B0T16DRAFT_388186 [Cercophora newfieldiana]
MTTPQRLEMVRRMQTAIATSYTTLGAWALLHPSSVLSLGFTPQYLALCNVTTSLFVRCWGAQAMTCGLVVGTSKMTPFSFTSFAVAMLPYIGWNFWQGLGPGRDMVTNFIWLDFAGNVFFTFGSLYCANLLREQEEEDKKKDI